GAACHHRAGNPVGAGHRFGPDRGRDDPMSLRLPRRRVPARLDPALAIVNIVLLLIFFFLGAGQSTQPPGDLQLAQTQLLPPGTLPSPVLELHGAERWLLDGQPILPDLLPAALAVHDGALH